MWTRCTETPPPEERLDVPPGTTGQFDLWGWRCGFVLDYLAPRALAMLHGQPEAVAVAVLRDFRYNDEGYTREISLLPLTDLPGASVSAVRLLCPQAWDGADGQGDAADSQGDAADSLPDIGSVDPREPGPPGPPGNDFQLHSNLALRPGPPARIDASTVSAGTLPWFRRIADLSRRLGAARYSLHAGYRRDCSLPQLADHLRRLVQHMELPVAVEGLYPARHDPFLLSTWAEYRWLLDEAPDRPGFAIDLSHLHILHCNHPADPGLVRALLSSPRCLEIHLSDNDGRADQHRPLPDPPDRRWWWPLLLEAMRWSRAEVFDEAAQRCSATAGSR